MKQKSPNTRKRSFNPFEVARRMSSSSVNSPGVRMSVRQAPTFNEPIDNVRKVRDFEHDDNAEASKIQIFTQTTHLIHF